MRNIRKEVEIQLLGEIYSAIGIDKPENHEDIVDFIVEDVRKQQTQKTGTAEMFQ